MAFDSFRDFVQHLDKAGELKRITQPVATELEINDEEPKGRSSHSMPDGAPNDERERGPTKKTITSHPAGRRDPCPDRS